MIIIFGGAYQGKLEYALEQYKLTMDDVFDGECISNVESAEMVNLHV